MASRCSDFSAAAALDASTIIAWKVRAMKLKSVYVWRGPVAALPVIFSVGCFVGECENDFIIWPLGVLLLVIGWALRMWAQKHLGYRLHIKRTVTTSGPYALVRNPIYIANTLVILGAVVMSEVLWLIPVALLWCALVYSLVVQFEEQHLASKYGAEYLDYLRAAPRWWPRLGSPSGPAHFHSSCSQIVLAEAYVVLIMAVPLVKEFILAPFLE
jgi:protein-S-isoprenylcysteine O-methyltransferase Ste14